MGLRLRCTLSLSTPRAGPRSTSPQAGKAIQDSNIQNGLCVIYCPHTTAAITVNENADPDVTHDPLLGTWRGVYFREFDGPRNRTFYVKVDIALMGRPRQTARTRFHIVYEH